MKSIYSGKRCPHCRKPWVVDGGMKWCFKCGVSVDTRPEAKEALLRRMLPNLYKKEAI